MYFLVCCRMRITMQCKADDYYYSRCCFSYLQFAGKKVQWQQSEWIKSEKSLSSCHHKLREKFRDLRRYRVFQQVSRIHFLSFVTFWDFFLSKTCCETTPQNTIKAEWHSVWKSPKMSHFYFLILAFSTNFCPVKTDLPGNTVWPQASGFQKLAKMD